MTKNSKALFVFGEGIALVIGTIIGAGFLVLPYAALRAGIVAGLFWFSLLSVVVILLHTMYAEIVRVNDDYRHLPFYARIHLGKWAGRVSLASFVVGVFSGLLIYLLLGGQFLQLLVGRVIHITPSTATVVFGGIFSLLILANLKLSSRINLFITLLTTGILTVLGVVSVLKMHVENFHIPPTAPFFFPYGIILFSLVGYIAIPELHALLKAEHQPAVLLRPIVLWGTVCGIALSALFMVSILGVMGQHTSRIAIEGLGQKFAMPIVVAVLTFAFLEIANSFLIFGISIRKTLENDFRVSPKVSALAVTVLPLVLFLSGVTDIVKLIGVSGSVLASADAIMVVLIYRRLASSETSLRRLPQWVLSGTVILLITGGIVSLWFAR